MPKYKFLEEKRMRCSSDKNKRCICWNCKNRSPRIIINNTIYCWECNDKLNYCQTCKNKKIDKELLPKLTEYKNV